MVFLCCVLVLLCLLFRNLVTHLVIFYCKRCGLLAPLWYYLMHYIMCAHKSGEWFWCCLRYCTIHFHYERIFYLIAPLALLLTKFTLIFYYLLAFLLLRWFHAVGSASVGYVAYNANKVQLTGNGGHLRVWTCFCCYFDFVWYFQNIFKKN